MRAIVSHSYGELALEDIEPPELGPEHVLVRVRAAGVNPLDYHELRGTPRIARVALGLRRPKHERRGLDVAGTVEVVGAEVAGLEPGDEVYGIGRGSFGELVRATEQMLAPKPAGLSFEEASAIPVAGVTALQALRDRGHLQAGQKVLVYGASGGVGTFAVQLAKAIGAEVTGICSARNLEIVSALGANRVVDYTEGDFAAAAGRHDLVVNCAEGPSLADLRRALAPGGRIVLVSGTLGQMVASIPRRDMVSFIANVTRDDLLYLSGLVEAGQLKPVIERTYPLDQAADAIRHVESRHARGKVVVTP
jgi:NADPH:quinone reductase-like Zn-dependent oxidoreductase